MRLPDARGPIGAGLRGWLLGGAMPDPAALVAQVVDAGEVLFDDDLQLSLWTLYELHYTGFHDVDAAWEWRPETLAVRAALEAPLEAELRRRTRSAVTSVLDADGPLAERLFELTETYPGPSLARFMHREAERWQLQEFLVHASVYHLKEADPHTWAIPRITGRIKAALVEIQFDEYGAGRHDRLHADLYAQTMAACGLSGEVGGYLDRVPAVTLAHSNVMSLFGLHRRLRGAAVGHLGAFEATSSLPSRQVASGLRRLGFGEAAAHYFDEHVVADAVHEQLAIRAVCQALALSEPELEPDIVFGAVTCLLLDVLLAEQLLSAWQAGLSSLHGAPPGLQNLSA
ncbi:MAG: iron-containing redox enzyme family protein [Nocardioidaceae bacterium]